MLLYPLLVLKQCCLAMQGGNQENGGQKEEDEREGGEVDKSHAIAMIVLLSETCVLVDSVCTCLILCASCAY